MGVRESKANLKEISLNLLTFTYIFLLPISKGGINIISPIFIVLGIFLIVKDKKNIKLFLLENKLILYFIFLYFVGIIINFISIGGKESAIIYFYKNMYFLSVPILLYIVKIRFHKYFIDAFILGTLVGIIKSFEIFYKHYNLNYSSGIRVRSFYDIGRWSTILMFFLALVLPLIFDKSIKIKKKIFYSFSFILGSISMVLSNSRGPWLGILTSVFVFIFFYNFKRIKIYIIPLLLIVFSLNFIYDFQENKNFNRFTSIFDTKENLSNTARLAMWKEGVNFYFNNIDNSIFYFGTGIDNIQKPFENHLLESQRMEYLNKKYRGNFSTSDTHNTYLNTLIQLGIIYFLIYIFLFFLVFKDLFFKSLEKKDSLYKGIFIVLISHLVCTFFYSYGFTYEMYSFYLLLFWGIINRGEDSKNENKFSNSSL